MKRFAVLIFSLLLVAGVALAADWYDPTDARNVRRMTGPDPGPGWVRNPDDSAVVTRDPRTHQITGSLVPQRYYTWQNGAVVGMDAAERNAVDATKQRGRRRGIASALIKVRAMLQAAIAERAALEAEGKTAATLERFDEVVTALQAERDQLAALLP